MMSEFSPILIGLVISLLVSLIPLGVSFPPFSSNGDHPFLKKCRNFIYSVFVLLPLITGFYFLSIQIGSIEIFHRFCWKITFSLGVRTLSFLLAKFGCAGGLALAIGLFVRGALTAEDLYLYMVPSSSAPVPEGPQPVLEGKPIPKDREWEAISSGPYYSGVVHIPGEVEDVSSLSKLARLNGLLLWVQEHVLGGGIHPQYTNPIQKELDQTGEDSLPAKLEFLRRRELERFGLES